VASEWSGETQALWKGEAPRLTEPWTGSYDPCSDTTRLTLPTQYRVPARRYDPVTLFLSLKASSLAHPHSHLSHSPPRCRYPPCRFLNNFFEKCDYEQISAFCRSVLETKGTVFFSGVGKSGFIGQKISMTLVAARKLTALSPKHCVE
jgi:hypothetical protein